MKDTIRRKSLLLDLHWLESKITCRACAEIVFTLLLHRSQGLCRANLEYVGNRIGVKSFQLIHLLIYESAFVSKEFILSSCK